MNAGDAKALRWNAVNASKNDGKLTNPPCSHGQLVEASTGVGRVERRKESRGGRGGEKILMYCERKLSHPVESGADNGLEVRNPVPR